MVEIYNLPRDSLIKRVLWYQKRYGPYVEKRGIKANWKNLFRKPTLLEWTILAMLILGLFLGWAYKQDVAAYRQALEDCAPSEITLDYSNALDYLNDNEDINFTLKEASNNDTGIG